MGQKYWETDSFKKLQAEQYKRLGKCPETSDFSRHVKIDECVVPDQIREYNYEADLHFQLCSDFLHSDKMVVGMHRISVGKYLKIDDKDVQIFEMYCGGLSAREISRALNVPRQTVDYRILKILKIARIKPLSLNK